MKLFIMLVFLLRKLNLKKIEMEPKHRNVISIGNCDDVNEHHVFTVKQEKRDAGQRRKHYAHIDWPNVLSLTTNSFDVRWHVSHFSFHKCSSLFMWIFFNLQHTTTKDRLFGWSMFYSNILTKKLKSNNWQQAPRTA